LSAAVPVVAVDGPSGTGKGTLSLRIAQALGWHFLDSGALYRVLAHHATRSGVDLADEAGVTRLALSLPVEFAAGGSEPRVFLNAQDVTAAIRTEEGGAAASVVAALPAVRAALLERQRAFREAPGLVADGRDMGTVVFPDAAFKLFLTASPAARAERRYKQLKGKGIDVNLAALLEDIRRRDQRDEQREVAPLQPAPDAEILDTTNLGIPEVEARVRQLLRIRGIA
jgi:cytidylate kinase